MILNESNWDERAHKRDWIGLSVTRIVAAVYGEKITNELRQAPWFKKATHEGSLFHVVVDDFIKLELPVLTKKMVTETFNGLIADHFGEISDYDEADIIAVHRMLVGFLPFYIKQIYKKPFLTERPIAAPLMEGRDIILINGVFDGYDPINFVLYEWKTTSAASWKGHLKSYILQSRIYAHILNDTYNLRVEKIVIINWRTKAGHQLDYRPLNEGEIKTIFAAAKNLINPARQLLLTADD